MTATTVCLFLSDWQFVKVAIPPSCKQIPCAPFFVMIESLMCAVVPEWMRKPSCLLFLISVPTAVIHARPAAAIPWVPFLNATQFVKCISTCSPLAIAPHCLLPTNWQSVSNARPPSSAPNRCPLHTPLYFSTANIEYSSLRHTFCGSRECRYPDTQKNWQSVSDACPPSYTSALLPPAHPTQFLTADIE